LYTIYNNNDLDLGIAIGKLSDASEVYINGYKISEVGKKGPFLFSAYNFYQYYRIPFYLIGEDNLLEIKIVLYVKTNASLTDKILISNYFIIYKALYLIGILLILFFSEYSKIKINKLMKFIIYFFLFSFFI